MVEDMRDVMDPLQAGPRGDAQDEIVILATLVTLAEPADRLNEAAAKHAEMREHILRQHQIRVPIRLEIRVEASALGVDLVLVAEDQVEFGVRRHGLRNQVEGVLGQQVVVVKQGHELAFRQGKRTVAGCRDMAVLAAIADLDAPIDFAVMFEHGADMRRCRSVIGDAQLPMPVELPSDRVNGGPQIRLRRLVDRHHDRDQWWIGEPGDRAGN